MGAEVERDSDDFFEHYERGMRIYSQWRRNPGDLDFDGLCLRFSTERDVLVALHEDPLRIDDRTLSNLGPYELDQRIGHGGQGFVWLSLVDGRKLAIKQLPLRASAAAKRRFEREIRTLRSVPAHPNIVAIVDASKNQDPPYYVMDFVPGPSLDAVIAKKADRAYGSMPPKTVKKLRAAIAVFMGVVDAVAHLHAHGVVHSDIKPHNIVFQSPDHPILVDFGLVRGTGEGLLVTQSTEVGGTPYYMSPEQVRGEQFGPGSDVFSLAVTLFQLLTGKVPFSGATAGEVGRAIEQEELPDLRKFNNSVDRDLKAIIEIAAA